MSAIQIGSSQNISGNNTNSLTLSFTTSAGNNPVLIVAASHRDSLFSGSNVTGVTFGGDSLTFLGEVTSSTVRDVYTSLWYLVNPNITSDDIVVSYDNSVSIAKITAAQFLFVDQSSPVRNTNTAGGYGTDAEISVGTAIDDIIIDSIVGFSNGEWTPSASNGQEIIDVFGSLQLFTSMSKKDGTTSSATMRWSKSGGGREWALITASLRFDSSSSSSSSFSSSSSSQSSSSESSSSESLQSVSSSAKLIDDGTTGYFIDDSIFRRPEFKFYNENSSSSSSSSESSSSFSSSSSSSLSSSSSKSSSSSSSSYAMFFHLNPIELKRLPVIFVNYENKKEMKEDVNIHAILKEEDKIKIHVELKKKNIGVDIIELKIK